MRENKHCNAMQLHGVANEELLRSFFPQLYNIENLM